MYRTLESSKIIETADKLQRRVHERFPESGLSKVSSELLQLAEESASAAQYISRPLYLLRVVVGLLVIGILAILVAATFHLNLPTHVERFSEFLQALESGLNDIILIGAAIFFLTTIEARVKRGRALKAIYQLRVMAHVIDMHQLTKDPEKTLRAVNTTPSSPKTELTPFMLSRYLDYCSEMLSLLSKLSALYIQGFSDPVTLSAADDIEFLTTGLSQKIWQKITILHSVYGSKQAND